MTWPLKHGPSIPIFHVEIIIIRTLTPYEIIHAGVW